MTATVNGVTSRWSSTRACRPSKRKIATAWLACMSQQQASLPAVFRIGATGFGVGLGCGVGLGYGSPVSLRGVPVVESAAAGLGAGASQLTSQLARFLPPFRLSLPAGVKAGAGCGLGVGYGFGAGLFLKPSVAEAVARCVERVLAVGAERLAELEKQGDAAGPLSSLRSQLTGASAAVTDLPSTSEKRLELALSAKVEALAAAVARLADEQAALRAALCASLPPDASACQRQPLGGGELGPSVRTRPLDV